MPDFTAQQIISDLTSLFRIPGQLKASWRITAGHFLELTLEGRIPSDDGTGDLVRLVATFSEWGSWTAIGRIGLNAGSAYISNGTPWELCYNREHDPEEETAEVKQ